MRDNDERIIELLEALLQKFDPEAFGDTNVTVEDSSSPAGQYFSTGKNQAAAPPAGNGGNHIQFGFAARVVSVRPAESALLYLGNPSGAQPIHIAGGESFEMGSGDAPLGVSEVWVESYTGNETAVRLEAY